MLNLQFCCMALTRVCVVTVFGLCEVLVCISVLDSLGGFMWFLCAVLLCVCCVVLVCGSCVVLVWFLSGSCVRFLSVP